jgi:hypothetical protein
MGYPFRGRSLNYFNLAMELSDNVFAWHLCGVLTATNHNNLPCPDPEKVAREYLEIFYAEELAEKLEADANNATPEWSLS